MSFLLHCVERFVIYTKQQFLGLPRFLKKSRLPVTLTELSESILSDSKLDIHENLLYKRSFPNYFNLDNTLP